MQEKTAVYLVWWMPYDAAGHCYEGFERADYCLIGVYSTEVKAQAAVGRSKTSQRFCQHPDSFLIDKYLLDKDHWTSGFSLA